MRGVQVPMKHSLATLFELLGCSDKDQLREHYSDYRKTAEGMSQFWFDSLDAFLTNLDGDSNKSGSDTVGSFDWRYFLIEEAQSQAMPTVSIDFLHEITDACIQMVLQIERGDSSPSVVTNSRRMFNQRHVTIYRNWYRKRKKSQEWDVLGDRVEILWGPDYKDRHDYKVFRGDNSTLLFGVIPNTFDIPVVDLRIAVKKFTIGVRSQDESQRRLNAIAPQILKLLLGSSDPLGISVETIANKWPLLYGFSRVVEQSRESDPTPDFVMDVNPVLVGLTFLNTEASQELKQEERLDMYEQFLRESSIAQKLLSSRKFRRNKRA